MKVLGRITVPPPPPLVRTYEVTFLWPRVHHRSQNRVDGVGLLFTYLRWAASRMRPALSASIEDIS